MRVYRPNHDGRGIVEVADSGDGVTYGPFMVAGGPQGNAGSNGSDGRGISEIRATAGQEEDGRQNHGWQNHDFAPDDFAQAPFPETADLPAVIAKMNELITALRR